MNKYKVALLTVTQMDIGVTALAGVLQHHNIPAMILNLQTDEYGDPSSYPDTVVQQALAHLEGVEFVGISVQDLFSHRAMFIAEKIKTRYPDIAIIMGGIHAEIYPDECIASPFIDAVCIGDGYKTIIDFVTKWHNRETATFSNCWVRLPDGTIKKNTGLDYYCSADLDATPMPDYTYEHYWMLIDNELVWMKGYILSPTIR